MGAAAHGDQRPPPHHRREILLNLHDTQLQPQPRQRLDSLTSMRFFAALLVAVHHTRLTWAHTALIDAIARVGWLGVSYFFILSGFVLMWGFDPALPKSSFIWKRFVRIYPLHFVCLIASLGAFVL